MPPAPSRSRLRCAMAMALVLALAAVWAPADSGTELLDAASKGLTAKVGELLAKGASMGAKDKNGRTALMLAAQHGHAETVRVLLEKGASADDRDARGYTAYGLAMFSPAGARTGIDEVLTVLPRPPRPHLAVETAWSAQELVGADAEAAGIEVRGGGVIERPVVIGRECAGEDHARGHRLQGEGIHGGVGQLADVARVE